MWKNITKVLQLAFHESATTWNFTNNNNKINKTKKNKLKS